jgi:hypothetical protein
MRLLGTLVFQRRVQRSVRCFARRFLGCGGLVTERWHHPVFPEAGSTICDQPESRDANRALAPAYALPMMSAEADGRLRTPTAGGGLNSCGQWSFDNLGCSWTFAFGFGCSLCRGRLRVRRYGVRRVLCWRIEIQQICLVRLLRCDFYWSQPSGSMNTRRRRWHAFGCGLWLVIAIKNVNRTREKQDTDHAH